MTQEACNGPLLQDGTAQATGTIISDMAGATIGPPPAATKPVEPHDVVRLVSLLREARDMIDHLARPSDTGAHELRSEEHTSELQSLLRISYAVFCLKQKTYRYTLKALA